jgi:DegV family protein with EDD domain
MPGTQPAIAVVTDSTASLPPDLSTELVTVPLTVVLAGRQGREGVDVTPADVAQVLTAPRAAPVTTSRPPPDEFAAVYQRLLDAGHDGVVSVHLSARLSGTVESAALAADRFASRVVVVDSRATGMGLGFPALAAARAATAGGGLSEVRAAAQAAVDRTTTLFYVDSLEFLRRGGRIGAASALLGTALSVKAILTMSDGVIVLREKVRTTGRALARLVELAAEYPAGSTVDIAVHHLAAPERAAALAAALSDRMDVRTSYLTEVGAVLGAHAGPGLICAVVHRLR